MKPFDIQKARLGERVVQRGGGEALYVGVCDRVETEYPFVFQVLIDNRWEKHAYTPRGKFIGESMQDDRDLFMAPIVFRQLWVQAYERKDGSLAFISADTRDNLATDRVRALNSMGAGRFIGEPVKISDRRC